MSNRAHRRRHARTQQRHARPLDPAGNYGTIAAWCATEDDLPAARQQTHDRLVLALGNTRTGGVQWKWWTGVDADEALSHLRADATGEVADYYRRIAGMLREYGGYLVVALALGKEQ